MSELDRRLNSSVNTETIVLNEQDVHALQREIAGVVSILARGSNVYALYPTLMALQNTLGDLFPQNQS